MFSRRSLLRAALQRDALPVVLFRQGEAGVHTYRIPALARTSKGTLLAVADARRDNSRDLPGKIALVLRTSRDNGRTWTPLRTLRSVDSGGVGDASLLVDPRTKRIWCFHAYGPPGIGFFTATPGGPPLEVHAIHSDDDGASWSAPVNLTPQLKDPAWHAMFATSGTHFATRRGRFIVPMVVRDEARKMSARNAYSDDGGATWRMGPSLGEATDESKAVELPDGGILQNMRRPGGTRVLALSRDGGLSFGPLPTQLADPGCNAGLAAFPNGTLFFTNADSSSRRERLTLKKSADGGRTWTLVKVLHAGPAAYSTIVPIGGNSLGIFYECGERDSIERMEFQRVRV